MVSRDIEVYIDTDGTVQFVYSDDAAAMLAGETETSETQRASHVEPEGDNWCADLAPVGGPKLGPFTTRAEALGAEVAWLANEMARRRVVPQDGRQD